MNSIISLDPGGKTGIYFRNGEQEQFLEINKNWKETYLEIKELVKEKKADKVIYEDTNYIINRSKESLSLFRLLGALECLEVGEVKSINVVKVKELTKKLLSGLVRIKEIEYLKGRGKGWMFKGKRVSIHCLEAYLVFYLS